MWNSDVDVRTFCRGMDAYDWLKWLERHMERCGIVNEADKVKMLLEKAELAIQRQLRVMVDRESAMNYPALKDLLQKCQ